MSALRILPLDILMRAADPAASTLMTALVAHLHPDAFPLIDLSRTEHRTQLLRALGGTSIVVQYMQMALGITLESNAILLIF